MANEKTNADLLIEIIDHHLSVDDVKKRIQEMETEYGADYFLDYDIEEAGIERKPKQDWDDEYYEKVKTKGILGIASKQYFLYFAEVNEYIYNKRAEEQKKIKHKKMTVAAAAVVAVILIAVFIICFFGTNEDSAENIYYQTIQTLFMMFKNL